MKRIILLIIIIAAALGFFLYKKNSVAVAGVSNNANFVSNEKFETTLQSNLNLIWNELEKQRNDINATNARLDAIGESINEINTELAQ